MTYREARNLIISSLKNAGIEEAEQESLILLEYVTGMDRTAYLLYEEQEISETRQIRLISSASLRTSHCPLQYITGRQEFYGLSFQVNTDVLIPRPETELLVEKVLALSEPGDEVLDLGTGSGCIAVAVAHERPDVSVTAADVSRFALDTARQNAKQNKCSVEFIESDLFDQVDGSFDRIVSNPPYIRRDEIDTLMPEVSKYEPKIALDGGEDGLAFYRLIIEEAPAYLKPGGTLAFEIGHDQADDVTHMLQEQGFTEIAVTQDYNNLDRVITASHP